MAHHDLADAVNVRIVDADFDAVGHRHARGVGIGLALGVKGVGAERFGLAVQRAQRHAHGLEELEGIGAERRAAGRGRAQPGEAEAVAQRAEQQHVGKRRMLAVRQRRQPRLHADLVEALLERGGIHHAGAHVGGDRFPHPRRKQHKRRRDLAEIVHHGLGLLDEVDLHPAQQAFAEHIDLFHDPGQRQHRDVFVVRSLGIEGEIGRAMPQHAPRGEHRQLRMRRGARGGAEDRGVLAFGLVHQFVVEARLARGAVAAHRGELVGLHQPRVVIFPHAARIGIDDVLEVGHALGERQQLVDLLFVLGEHQFGLAIGEEIGGFLVQHVAVETEAHGADRMGGDFGRHPVRPVVADDADDVAAAKPELDQAEREVVHPRLVVVPGEHAPEPKILFAQRDLAAMLFGVEPQQFRVGIGLRNPARVIHHAAHSGAAGLSSGSTSTSSSSPR